MAANALRRSARLKSGILRFANCAINSISGKIWRYWGKMPAWSTSRSVVAMGGSAEPNEARMASMVRSDAWGFGGCGRCDLGDDGNRHATNLDRPD
jgi:hypothetical protein